MRFALILLVLWPALAWASPAEEAFRAGRFAQAAELGRKAADANGDAIAARATLTVAAYETADRQRAESLIDLALADARRALSKDPGNIEARIQLAIGTGYRAKLRQSPGLAKEARTLMDAALKAAPTNAFAWAALAGWHGESVADLGGFIAGTVLGAKKSEALRLYPEALKRDAASPTFPTFFAFTLLRLGSSYQAQAADLLARATAAAPRDGFEALMHKQASDVLAALRTNDRKRALALIKRYQPFGQILGR
jgi:tetratricopeptide (TPR) repeat protein